MKPNTPAQLYVTEAIRDYYDANNLKLPSYFTSFVPMDVDGSLTIGDLENLLDELGLTLVRRGQTSDDPGGYIVFPAESPPTLTD